MFGGLLFVFSVVLVTSTYVLYVIWHSCLRKQTNLEYKIYCVSSKGFADFGEHLWQETRRAMSEKDNYWTRKSKAATGLRVSESGSYIFWSLGGANEISISGKIFTCKYLGEPLESRLRSHWHLPNTSKCTTQFEFGAQDFPFKNYTMIDLESRFRTFGSDIFTYVRTEALICCFQRGPILVYHSQVVRNSKTTASQEHG